MGASAASAFIVFLDIAGPQALEILFYGGLGGLSRWVYFMMSGTVERWYRGFGFVILGMAFALGAATIGGPIIGIMLGADDGWMVRLVNDPGSIRGLSYFMGMFSTVIIGALSDIIESRSKKGGGDDA